MRAALLALMLTFATQADAWFDIFAKEKYLHCVFKDNDFYRAVEPKTLLIKGYRITQCHPHPKVQKAYKIERHKVTKTEIDVICKFGPAGMHYKINRITGHVTFAFLPWKLTEQWEGRCTLRDAAF